MTKKHAMEVLLMSAVRFHNGVGLGISTGITSKDREEIKEAVKKIWPYLYKHEITDNEWWNLHM